VDVRGSHPQRLAGNEGWYVVSTATRCSKCYGLPSSLALSADHELRSLARILASETTAQQSVSAPLMVHTRHWHSAGTITV
jgi:hypothetical protein